MNIFAVAAGFILTIALGLVVIASLKRSERNREAFEDAHLTPPEKMEPAETRWTQLRERPARVVWRDEDEPFTVNPGLSRKSGTRVEGEPSEVAQKIARGEWR